MLSESLARPNHNGIPKPNLKQSVNVANLIADAKKRGALADEKMGLKALNTAKEAAIACVAARVEL